LDTWIRSGLPWLAPAVSEIFPTANGLPVPKSNLHRRFRDYIDELGYPPGLDIHSLRRSYVTHLFEHFGFDHTFVQRQVGHEHASTTSLYTLVSSDYQTSELNRVLEDMVEKAVRPKEERE
jgi:site-specific recombinase XerD